MSRDASKKGIWGQAAKAVVRNEFPFRSQREPSENLKPSEPSSKTINNLQGAKRLKQIQAFFERVPVFPLDLVAAAYAGKIYADLKSKGKMVGNQGILMAGACLANGLPLLTRNRTHFAPIKGLVIY